MKDKIIISAAVPNEIAAMEIQEIMLIALFDFFEIKYLLAMKKETFKYDND